MFTHAHCLASFDSSRESKVVPFCAMPVLVIIEKDTPPPTDGGVSKWANRKLLPQYEAMLKTGAFTGGTDSSIALSEERDAR
jgi:hypothetical protein